MQVWPISVGQITTSVRQALYGNVGTLVLFRLGADDSQTIARELGAFTAEEVLNLEVGQAFVRSGMSANTFNLNSPPKPESPNVDPSPRIQALNSTLYARPLLDVEAELGNFTGSERITIASDAGFSTNPEDPSEDDLLN